MHAQHADMSVSQHTHVYVGLDDDDIVRGTQIFVPVTTLCTGITTSFDARCVCIGTPQTAMDLDLEAPYCMYCRPWHGIIAAVPVPEERGSRRSQRLYSGMVGNRRVGKTPPAQNRWDATE